MGNLISQLLRQNRCVGKGPYLLNEFDLGVRPTAELLNVELANRAALRRE